MRGGDVGSFREMWRGAGFLWGWGWIKGAGGAGVVPGLSMYEAVYALCFFGLFEGLEEVLFVFFKDSAADFPVFLLVLFFHSGEMD